MTLSWLSHKFLRTYLLLSHDFLMDISWLSHAFLMILSWISHDFLMTFSWLSFWLSHDFFMNFSWLSHDLFMTSYDFLNWSWFFCRFGPCFTSYINVTITFRSLFVNLSDQPTDWPRDHRFDILGRKILKVQKCYRVNKST